MAGEKLAKVEWGQIIALYPTTPLRLPGIAELRKWQSKKPAGLELGNLHKHLINSSLYIYIVLSHA